MLTSVSQWMPCLKEYWHHQWLVWAPYKPQLLLSTPSQGHLPSRSRRCCPNAHVHHAVYTATAGFLHVSGHLRDSGELYQGLLAWEFTSQGVILAWERTRTVTLYTSVRTLVNSQREALHCAYVSLVTVILYRSTVIISFVVRLLETALCGDNKN